MSIKKISAIVIFVLVGLITFTFAGEDSLTPTGEGVDIGGTQQRSGDSGDSSAITPSTSGQDLIENANASTFGLFNSQPSSSGNTAGNVVNNPSGQGGDNGQDNSGSQNPVIPDDGEEDDIPSDELGLSCEFSSYDNLSMILEIDDINFYASKDVKISCQALENTNKGIKNVLLVSGDRTVFTSKDPVTNSELYNFNTTKHDLEDGKYTLVVCDVNNNCMYNNFILDNVGPLITNKDTNEVISNGDIFTEKTKISVYDESGLLNAEKNTKDKTYKINEFDTTIKLVSKNEKEHTITVSDNLGNITTVSYIIDKTAPTINVLDTTIGTETNELGEELNTFSKLDLESYDENLIQDILLNGESIKKHLRKNGSNFKKNTVMYTLDKDTKNINADGENILVVIDKAGHETTLEFTLDSTAPDISIKPTRYENGGKTTLKVKSGGIEHIYETDEIITFINNPDGYELDVTVTNSNTGENPRLNFNYARTYFVEVSATDLAGNMTTLSHTFIVEDK